MQRLAIRLLRKKVDLVHGVNLTLVLNFRIRWNTVIPIGMAEYCLKSGRIPPKSEWLAAMLMYSVNFIVKVAAEIIDTDQAEAALSIEQFTIATTLFAPCDLSR